MVILPDEIIKVLIHDASDGHSKIVIHLKDGTSLATNASEWLEIMRLKYDGSKAIIGSNHNGKFEEDSYSYKREVFIESFNGLLKLFLIENEDKENE